MSPKDVIILGCSSQQPTRYRNHGAYLIRWNEEGFLFDPGEGTQRQFIFANIAPPSVNRIFISHFHGDHCLGVGSMLMRLNLDKVQHPIHCYYPASGKKNFKYLRYGSIYHETINIIEHPIKKAGLIEETDKFKIEANFLHHGIDNLGWRITEKDKIKFKKDKLKQLKIPGKQMPLLLKNGYIKIKNNTINLEDVSYIKKGDSIAVIIDTKPCNEALLLSQDAKILICESTFLEKEKHLAQKYLHMTARQAAKLAKKSNVTMLILTHFSSRYKDLKPFSTEAKDLFPNVYLAEDFKRFNFPK